MASQRWRAATEYYVGLDVSLKQTSICVVNQRGSIVQEGVVDSDPEAIALFVRSRAGWIFRALALVDARGVCRHREQRRRCRANYAADRNL